MKCEEIMKKNAKCVAPDDTVQAAAELMRSQNVGFLPVCDEAGRVVGTITDRDLAIRVIAAARSATTEVEDVYSREVVACRPSDDLSKAEELMAQHQKSRIMCTDTQGKLVGVISLSDIAEREPELVSARTLREVSRREARA